MIEGILQQVRAVASGDRALRSVHALAGFHRVQSSPGYEEAAQWVGRELETCGLIPRWERVVGDGYTRALGVLQPRGWDCASAHAWLHRDGERSLLCDYDRSRLSLVLRSAGAVGTYPLMTVDDGSEADHYEGRDVRGKVVLSSAPVHRVHQLAVVERGAAGILSDTRRLVTPVRLQDDERDALNYTSFWWASETPRGWGFVVTPQTGDVLRQALAQGEALQLEVEIDAREYETQVSLLTTEIPGTLPGEILLLSHLCHPQPSANDNASGAAALLETARVLHLLADGGHLSDRRRTLRFLWMPELTGTAAWLGADRARARDTLAALNLDMVGEDQMQCGSTLHVERPPLGLSSFTEVLLRLIRDRAQDWVTSYSGPGHYSMLRTAEIPYGGGSDHAVLLDPSVGVPCPLLIQWPDRFYHSSHDTPDRTDPASLEVAVRCAATYAGFLAGAGPGEVEWLLDAVARDARRNVLTAHERTEPAREVAAAHVRGSRSIDSMARLSDDHARIAAARSLFDAFCTVEARSPEPLTRRPPARGVRAESTAGAACPRRRIAGPLEFHTHLLPGFESLDIGAREDLHQFMNQFPGGRLTIDLAWMNCNGQHTLDEMAWLIWLETGVEVPVEGIPSAPGLKGLFQWMERLGLTSFRHDTVEEWSPGAPDGATP